MVASPIVVEGCLWGVVTVLTTRGPFPADTADRLADFTELVATAVGNADSRAELAASRARIVAASDETRRRIERDLHDGTQQRLVSLGLELRLAQGMVPAELRELETEIGKVADELTGVIEDLREIARGIHPAILSEGRLGRPCRRWPAGPRSRSSSISPRSGGCRSRSRWRRITSLGGPHQRDQARARVGCRSGRGSLRKHAPGVRARRRCRGADQLRGSGLVGLRDRIEALGGTFSVHSPAGHGTMVSCELPVVASAVQPNAAPSE